MRAPLEAGKAFFSTACSRSWGGRVLPLVVSAPGLSAGRFRALPGASRRGLRPRGGGGPGEEPSALVAGFLARGAGKGRGPPARPRARRDPRRRGPRAGEAPIELRGGKRAAAHPSSRRGPGAGREARHRALPGLYSSGGPCAASSSRSRPRIPRLTSATGSWRRSSSWRSSTPGPQPRSRAWPGASRGGSTAFAPVRSPWATRKAGAPSPARGCGKTPCGRGRRRLRRGGVRGFPLRYRHSITRRLKSIR